jgi:hypothetical protein
MTIVSPSEQDFKDFLPNMPDDNEFSIKVVLPSTGDSADRKVHFDDYKIWIKNPNDALIKFSNIDVSARKCAIESTPK